MIGYIHLLLKCGRGNETVSERKRMCRAPDRRGVRPAEGVFFPEAGKMGADNVPNNHRARFRRPIRNLVGTQWFTKVSSPERKFKSLSKWRV